MGGTVIKKYAKFGDFVTGVLGGYIDEKGNLEMESGVFRKRLFVPEIAYNRTTYFKGRMVNSPVVVVPYCHTWITAMEPTPSLPI